MRDRLLAVARKAELEIKRRENGRKENQKEERREDAWKRPKKVKIRIEHETLEQIVAEAGESGPTGIGIIIDVPGAIVRPLPQSHYTFFKNDQHFDFDSRARSLQ